MLVAMDATVSHARSALTLLAAAAALLLAACSGSPATCSPIPLAVEAEEQQAAARAALTFEPVPPCSVRSDLEVVRVLEGSVPAQPPEPRISYIVDRRGERAFTLSETRAELPFRAIPPNTEHLRAGAGEVTAAGFAGTASGGDEIAYLRWRIDGVTYELAATLYPWLTPSDVQTIAAALIDRTGPASPGE